MKKMFQRADASQYSLVGYKYQKPSANAKKYTNNNANQKLPPKVDLRKLLTPIEDQDQTNSCVAHAVAGAYEYLAKQHLEKDYDVSRMFIYYNARYLDTDNDEEIEDNGSYIQKAIEGLKEYGACAEESYPFELDTINEEPHQEAYDEGANFLVEDTQFVQTDLSIWKSCLANGNPIVFAIQLYQSFEKQSKKGVVPMPTPKESSRGSHGVHAMLAVGYSDKDRCFIVRNSWGKNWGDKGYCYMPYDYVIGEDHNCDDSWIIKQLNMLDLDTDSYWYDDEESVVGDYDTELSQMAQEDYEAMIDDMGDYLLEYRIALLFLYASYADSEVSDEEYESLGEYMDDILVKIDSNLKSSKVLKFAMQDVDNKELIEETIELFGQYFSHDFLVNLIAQIEEVAMVDELSNKESRIIEKLMNAWGITEDDYEYEEGEDDEEELVDNKESHENDEATPRIVGRKT
jgi:C1A family cysteine protease